MKKQKIQKLLSLALGTAMAFSLFLTACNNSSGTNGTKDANAGSEKTDGAEKTKTDGSGEEAQGERIDITWMSILHTDSPPSDEMVKAISDFGNVNLTYNWVPASSIDENMNTALASNELADIVTMNRMTNATQRAALANDMFWDVEPFLKDYPNLAGISEERLDSIRINGKIYGVPIVKPVARYGIVIRKDWLDKIGKEVPHTMKDLIEVAKAFVSEDPDGNGKDDTYAFVERKESWAVSFRQVAGWYGAPNKWGVNDEGKVEPWFMHDGYFKALEVYKDLYDAKAINSDFAVMEKKDQQQAAAQGKGGIIITGLYDARNFYNMAVELGMEGEMEWALINDMTADGGEVRSLSDTNNGVGGLYAMPKSEVKDEAELKRILQFINDLAGEEGFKLLTNGIEGVHYTVENDMIKQLDEEKWKQEVQGLSGSRIDELVTYNFKVENPMMQESNDKILENEKNAIFDVSLPLESETFNTLYGQIEQIPNDAYYKFVMGEITMDDVKAANEDWLSQGGQKMIDEFTASYAELNK